MGYYMRGDYYRGDYYRGDLWSFLGGAAKKVGGAIVSGAKTAFAASPGVQILKGAAKAVGGIPHFGGGPPGAPGPMISGGGPASPSALPAAAAVALPGMMRGYHLNKSKLGPSRAHPKGAAPHTVMVRNRHMNAANPRALARASRRAHGFLRMASKFVRYYRPKAHKGRAYIGRRRKSR